MTLSHTSLTETTTFDFQLKTGNDLAKCIAQCEVSDLMSDFPQEVYFKNSVLTALQNTVQASSHCFVYASQTVVVDSLSSYPHWEA